MKTCFVCKTISPRNQMLRFVGGAGEIVQFDAKEVLPGRGMWLHADESCLERAIEKRLFQRVAKGVVTIPGDLMDVVKKAIQNHPEKQKLFFQRSNS
ncbi:MAG: YlxR family protein [Alphaproteobacteria bacterium]|nr:YlxR family protein [Alphaproteobacteria bacterium]